MWLLLSMLSIPLLIQPSSCYWDESIIVTTNRDPSILFNRDFTNNIIIMMGIYVDDIVIASNYNKAKDKIKIQLSQEY